MERVDILPRRLGARLDSDGSSLVVHAPGIEVADQFPEEVTERTELPADPSGPVAVIDFYRLSKWASQSRTGVGESPQWQDTFYLKHWYRLRAPSGL
jgi:hypothetical protein